MKPIISKTPEYPSELSTDEVRFLTEATFERFVKPKPCDALFVFGGTHSGHWTKATDAYQKGYVNKIIVTGGRSLTGTAHEDWTGETEASVICHHLLEAGVPKDAIVFEDKSTNSLENVLYAKNVFDFDSIRTLMVVCKSHTAGRQMRTLAQHLPKHITFVPYPFNATYKGDDISRDNWAMTEIGKSRVWGEYLRLLHYGEKGDILPLDNPLSLDLELLTADS